MLLAAKTTLYVVLVTACMGCIHAELACKRVHDGSIFSGELPAENIRVQGSPGKQGEKGEPGTVEYDKVNARILKKIDEAIRNMNKLMDEKVKQIDMKIDAKLQEANKCSCISASTTTTAQPPRVTWRMPQDSVPKDLCGVRLGGICYWASINKSKKIPYAVGRKICSENNSYPANIYSNQHYVKVQNYIRSKMPQSLLEVTLWLGMTFNPQADEASFSDGNQATFKKWHPLHRALGLPGTQMAINTKKDATDKLQGMSAAHTDFKAHGVLCQI